MYNHVQRICNYTYKLRNICNRIICSFIRQLCQSPQEVTVLNAIHPHENAHQHFQPMVHAI